MSENRVVIYSNGIADFQRGYQIEADAGRKISIPVRQDHLADVLASFNVYGNVKLETPPTFRPANESEGNISIDPDSVLEGLATSLSGSRIRVEHSGNQIEGRLVGLHAEPEASAGSPIKPKSLVILTDSGMKRCPLREIQSFEFLDDAVRTEIDKALQRNYQRIKPNSTFVELELSAGESTEAIVQYTIPAAAWKISYRLRMAEEGNAELQGFAIVDNNTDEDWIDFQIAVVTGEPITFSTDLADSKSPRREHVDLVSGEALGAVEVERAMTLAAPCGSTRARKMSKATADYMIEESADGGLASNLANLSSAETEYTSASEVGDFSVFESQAVVSIPAKRSAVIPVFQVAVTDARTVLHYKYENHQTRAYRSVDFTNETGFSLGRGVCTVYEEHSYAGNCIVPPLKHEESRLLPHALETGVLFELNHKRRRSKVIGIQLAKGICTTQTQQRREAVCQINNSRDREFKVVFDYARQLTESEVEATWQTANSTEGIHAGQLPGTGLRYSLVIPARSSATIRIAEQRIESSAIHLFTDSKRQETLNIGWIEQNLIATNGPLANDENVLHVMSLATDLKVKQQEITDLVHETERLAERQKRLRENIKSGGQDELTSRWRNDLDAAETSLRRIEEEQVPALRTHEKEIRARLMEAVRGLSIEWSE